MRSVPPANSGTQGCARRPRSSPRRLAKEHRGPTRRCCCYTLRLLSHQGLNIAIFLAVADDEPIELGAGEPGSRIMLVMHRERPSLQPRRWQRAHVVRHAPTPTSNCHARSLLPFSNRGRDGRKCCRVTRPDWRPHGRAVRGQTAQEIECGSHHHDATGRRISGAAADSGTDASRGSFGRTAAPMVRFSPPDPGRPDRVGPSVQPSRRCRYHQVRIIVIGK